MRLRADPLQRDASALVGNAVLGAVAGFLFWLVAARTASPAEVGAAAATVSAFTLAALLGRMGADAVLVRHLPRLAAGARRSLLRRVYAATVLASAGAAVALLALGVVPGEPVRLLFVASAVAIAAAWALDARFLAERRAGLSFARNAVFHGSRLALVAVPLVGIGLADAWAVAAALSLVVAFVARPHAPDIGEVSVGVPWRTALANHTATVLDFLPALAMPLVVAASEGAEANAAFYVAWTLAAVPLLAARAVGQATFAELAGGAAPGALARAARLQATVVVPAVVAGLLAGPWALGIFGASYGAAWPVLAVLLLALVPAAVNALAVARLRAEDRRVPLIALSGSVAFVSLAATALLLPRLGLFAPALAWFGANVLALPWSISIAFPRWSAAARKRGRAHAG